LTLCWTSWYDAGDIARAKAGINKEAETSLSMGATGTSKKFSKWPALTVTPDSTGRFFKTDGSAFRPERRLFRLCAYTKISAAAYRHLSAYNAAVSVTALEVMKARVGRSPT
jgi:hypothetical protein